jgi:hypothetical protein
MARPWTMVLPRSTSRYAVSNPDQPIFADLLILDDSDSSSLNPGYGNGSKLFEKSGSVSFDDRIRKHRQ